GEVVLGFGGTAGGAVLTRIASPPPGDPEIAAKVPCKSTPAADPAQAAAANPSCAAEAAQASPARHAHVGRTTYESCGLGLGNSERAAQSACWTVGSGPGPLGQVRLLNRPLRKRRPPLGKKFRAHVGPAAEDRCVAG